ncbi:hypothetical protein FGKAn22_00220 [Ferrigenium kumadai]|uniref:PilY1 beta-propeller domain-containing protein n=1 Tax=Ferrigenium kumadai TaxID=1682490 RepID=A0AAN1VYN0_9PROT|nr:PilC/PilY family type IV pilus protein [Ferrigenium kumadai]BBI98329.1 hypothetical protein FGKAn22_00220 [Ferrigenium kumadai]
MSTQSQKTFASAPLLGFLALFGISLTIIKLAAAITAFSPVTQPVGFVAQDEVSNYNLVSGRETLFRPEYEKEFWSGNLYAYPVDTTGNVNVSGELWPGGTQAALNGQNFNTGRLIATMKDDGSKVPFRWASLSTTATTGQQAVLATTVSGVAVSGDKVLDFIRGDRSNEAPNGVMLRKRKGVMGAVIHSRPYYISDSITPTIFVAANDGMLHAFDATVGGSGVGAERWAYVPSMLIPKLKGLVANPYTFDYYVDGQINVAMLPVGATPTQRILVGGLGSGGKGLFALDITSLTATTEQEVANKILWEVTPAKVNYANPTTANAYTNLGYVYGTPLIAKVHGTPTKDAIIVGNGYNDNASGDYQAYLYVIDAATGQLIQKIKAGTSGTSASPNGLYSVNAIDVDGDGVVDRVYGGDLNGTLWKFDLSSNTNTSWSAVALHTTSPAQPITSTPSIALHPNGGYMVSFGTGAVFTSADMVDNAVHYVYGIWDGAPVANTSLLTQTLTERTYGTTRVRRSTANTPNWSSGGHKGWKMALPAGERITGEGSFTESGRFYFNSYNPTITHAVPNTTTTITGENWLMELDYLMGGSKNQPFLDMNGDLLLNDADRITYTAADTIPTGKAIGNPIPGTDGIPVGKWLSYGVQSQPILVQLRTLNTTLFNQNPDVTFPPQTAERGVAGGHFDVDNYLTSACDTTSGGKATGTITLNYSSSKNPSDITVKVGTTTIASGNPSSMNKSDMATWVSDKINTSANYTATANRGVVTITAKAVGTAYNGTLSITITGATGLGESVSGMSGGSAATTGNDVSTSCSYDTHTHEYDDAYDKTGLNMLNASKTNYNLSNHISSTSTQFKVLLMNQYLSPAVSLHIDTANYDPASGNGYISIKDYQTSANLDIATVPTYTRATLRSLALNMPVNAFQVKNWWGSSPADMRVGLHPTQPGCVWDGNDPNGKADLYQPVIPPANGTNGPGTDSTTEGARHNGALTVQIIKATTPQAAIEENVAGRPEYGWRVKSSYYSYVLAEYNVYWHHPNGMCYGSTGTWSQTNRNGDAWNTTALMNNSDWKKDVPEDTAPTSASVNKTPATGSTDPKLGSLGSSCGNQTTTTTTSGNVTTITSNCTLADGTNQLIYRITKTTNNDGTVTIVTTLADGTSTTEIIANATGNVKTGGDERGLQARTGRVSWHELVR